MHHPCTALERGCDGMWTDKTSFFFPSWRVIRRVWRSSRRLDTMGSYLLVLLLSLTTSAICQDSGVGRPMIEFPLKFISLSIKQICSALPRCNLAGKALKRISQCHLLVGWLQGKPCLTWKGWKLPLEISKLHVCLGEYRLCPCVSIRVNFWERGQVGLHSLLAGSDSIRKVRSYWRGELSWNLNRLLCYYSPIKPCYLKYDLRTRQQWHHLETVRNVGSPSHTCWIRICFSQGPQEAHSRLRNLPLCYLGHQWPAHGSNLVEIRDFWNSVSLPSCYRTANILPCPNPRN